MTRVMQIKFNEPVWHDAPYLHPQLRTKVIQDFFDRSEIKTKLRTCLVEGNSRLTIIQGERRSGKTSLLRLLEHDLKIKSTSRSLPLWLPWQGVVSRDSLVNELLESCAFELDVDLPFFVPEGSVSDSILISALRQLATDAEKTIVVFIDEFDSIIEQSPPAEGVRILQLITNLITAADLQFNLVMTIVKVPEIDSALTIHQNEIWTLSPFQLQDLEEMVNALLPLPKGKPETNLISDLYDLSGGWPYFAKLLLMCLAEQEEAPFDLKSALSTALEHPLLERALDHIYTKHFSWAEQYVVLALAMNNNPMSVEKILTLKDDLEIAVVTLVQRHFLERLPNGEIRFRIGLLNYWFPQWIRYQEELENHIGRDAMIREDSVTLYEDTMD